MKIYLAGPDVFFKDSKEKGKWLKEKCKEYGHEGLYPLDNEIKGETKSIISAEINKANVKMIDECDIVLANLMQWRGSEPDSGTVWECGYARGIGKDVFGYNTYGELKDHVKPDEYDIEDFGNPVNLMLAENMIIVQSNFETALKRINEIPVLKRMPMEIDVKGFPNSGRSAIVQLINEYLDKLGFQTSQMLLDIQPRTEEQLNRIMKDLPHRIKIEVHEKSMHREWDL